MRVLKRFLAYAETGKLDMTVPSGRQADSPFEEEVADQLRRLGYEVEHQVGSGGFFIDLAVIDEDHPGRFLLGVECDGASYHSARSARDRDRLRQEVLERLGQHKSPTMCTDAKGHTFLSIAATWGDAARFAEGGPPRQSGALPLLAAGSRDPGGPRTDCSVSTRRGTRRSCARKGVRACAQGG